MDTKRLGKVMAGRSPTLTMTRTRWPTRSLERPGAEMSAVTWPAVTDGYTWTIAAPAAHVHARRGFLVAMTNPKTIAFFTAFLPQFIDPTLPVGHQLLVMCICSVTLGTVLDCGWAVVAGYGRSVFVKPQHNRLLGRLSALALIGGGIWLSLARRPG